MPVFSLMRPPRPGSARAVLDGVLVWAALTLAALDWWLRTTFGPLSVEQILFHWRFAGRLDNVDAGMLLDFVLLCIALPALLAAALTWAALLLVRRLRRRAPPDCPLIARRTRRLHHLATALSAGLLGLGAAGLASEVHALAFARTLGEVDYFGEHYVPPSTQPLQAVQPRNLVIVYAEAMESSYANTEVFGRNLLHELDALQPAMVPKLDQSPGGGWTMAGLVATQCGIPLQVMGAMDGNSQGERLPRFLPGATCLSDLLHERGYRNVFMGGASLQFSGKGKFLEEHHYDESFGRGHWMKQPDLRPAIGGWGLADDRLFEQATLKLDELHAAGRPFSLVLLTVDTHLPHGRLSDECRARSVTGLDGIIECSAGQIAALVRHLREQGYDRDTRVVVMGDHLAGANSLAALLDRVPQRHIYNAFFAREPVAFNREDMLQYDMLPTLLEFAGWRVPQGRLGLGYSALQPSTAQRPAAEAAALAAGALRPTGSYAALWATERTGGRGAP